MVKVRLAESAGFCFGVSRAAKLIEDIGKQAKIKDIRLEEANIDDIIRVAYGGTNTD